MFDLGSDLYENLFEENYQIVTHLASKLIRTAKVQKQTTVLNAILDYVEANDEWEKTYNFPHILQLFDKAINSFRGLLSDGILTDDEGIFTEVMIAVSWINRYAVEVENSMIMNDVLEMTRILEKSVAMGEETKQRLSTQLNPSEFVVSTLEYLDGYIKYQRGWQIYSELILQKRIDQNIFLQNYETKTMELAMIRDQLEDDDDTISMTEINGLVQNLKKVKSLVEAKTPKILITKSDYNLNISFYIGQDFARMILDNFSKANVEKISTELFSNNVEVVAGGIDQLDDFLQTSIGSEYADVLHLILPPGRIGLFDAEHEFEVHVLIRRFGSVTIQFRLSVDEDLTVSKYRTTLALVGPQTGISKIKWNGQEYHRLEQIVNILHLLFLGYHDIWKADTETIHLLHMDRVDYNPDRNWFSQGLIRQIHIESELGRTRIFSVKDLENLYEFKGLTLPLNEGRPTLDDWVEHQYKEWQNLALIRLHEDDFIQASQNTLTVFLPHDPEFINMAIISASLLVNDISALIIGFDSLADVVRGGLISQVHVAKKQLEEVNIKILNRNLNNIRKNVIETTEFELTAKQSIELLRSQNALKYHDHALFIQALIENSGIEPTIQNLIRKLELIKHNQEAIIRTSDDLLNKYQQEVSASQQRLVKVVTILIAGIAQISVVDQITAILPISDKLARDIKYGVIGFAGFLTVIALAWLLVSYLRSKKIIFDDN